MIEEGSGNDQNPDSEPEPAPDTALDALFGDGRFQDYDEALVPAQTAAPRRPAPRRPTPRGARAARAARTRIPTVQKVLISLVGALAAALALLALFFLGTKLPDLLGAAPAVATASASPSPTPSPAATGQAVGPVSPGVHGWNQLLGGECLNPYTTPWAERFTVVDCAAAHPAQLVFRGTFSPTTPSFPGVAALQAQISLLCTAPGVLDLAAAGQYTDAQLQGSYPVTSAEWDAGQHDYFCFVSRSSGQPLTGSLAAAKPAP